MKKLLILSLLLSIAIVSQANANVVDFDDAYANSIVGQQFNNSQSFSDEGLTFTSYGTFLYVWGNNSPNSNGTNSLIFAGFNTGDYLAITQTGGGAFNVSNIDMSISWYDTNASETIYANGSPLILGQGIQTYNLNLNGITELDITGVPGNTGYWLLDNVNNATGVPEPASMLLLGLGLVGLAGARRKFKK
jgi:PEP-CTERM motif